MAGDNGLSFNGLTHRTETTTHTTMANGGADQFFFFLLTPENGWVNILLDYFFQQGKIIFNILCSLKIKHFLLVKLDFSDQKVL